MFGNELFRRQKMALLISLLSLPALSWADDNQEVILLPVGSSYRINLKDEGPIRIRGKKFIVVQDRGHSLKVQGIAPGNAIIIVAHKSWSFRIVPSSTKDFINSLSIATRLMKGPKIILNSEYPEVSGHIYRYKDWQILADLAVSHNSQYRMRAQIDPDVREVIAYKLIQLLKEQGLKMPNISWRPYPVARFAIEDKNMLSILKEIFVPYGIEVNFENSQIPIQPLVRVKIVVAEVNVSARKKLGIDWPQSVTATISPKLIGPNPLEATLHALTEEGAGQILASPNLLARSGGEADFLAGGEFPIRIVSNRVREVQWKRHGIYLKIKPRADRTGRLSIELTTEVSLLDMGQQVDGIPSLKTNRIATHFDLTESKTIVLSGLIHQEWGEKKLGLPYLQSIPILGRLFSSNDFSRRESELIIFVTPEIVSDHSETEISYPKGWSHAPQ